MTTITVDTNVAEVSAFMRRLFRDQLSFSLARALNATAIDFQEEQRKHQRRIFDVRNPFFVDRSVKIRRGDFASKRKPEVTVRIEPPGGQKRADILTKFETGRAKTPFRGDRIAIPSRNVPRTGRGGSVTPAWRPKNLGFRKKGRKGRRFRQHGSGRVFRSKGDVFVGRKRTFAIFKPGGRGWIFERDFGDVILLYKFRPRVRIRDNLSFQQNARRVVAQRWAPNFAREFDRAVRTAR